MKVTYTIWLSDKQNHTATRTIDAHDIHDIASSFEDVLDLRELRRKEALREAAVREAERRIELLKEAEANPPPPRDDGPHKRVFEYDGAFQCLDCRNQWGALPGKPSMVHQCSGAFVEEGHE